MSAWSRRQDHDRGRNAAVRPADVPFNGTNVLDSDEIVEVPRLPRSLTVVGGGVIGVEYATIFSALDVSVALIESRPSLWNSSTTN